MTPERWEQIGALYQAAKELPPAERPPFLDRACAADAELRRELESLLAAEGAAEDFLITGGAIDDAAKMLAAEESFSLAGKTLGHYEVLSLLGAGGMGEVYLARDMKLGREVAIKVLPPAFSADKDRLRRFEQEASTASSLNHPNILTIHEIGAEGGQPFIATEYVDGESLREHIGRASLKLREFLDIGVQVASALSAAHGAGIVHRDIKPENIMLRYDGYVKVLDFGLAKLVEQAPAVLGKAIPARTVISTTAGTVMGTVSYMSPEQARGVQVDARTDIWSLGVVLYEMATGHVPFEGETTSDRVAAILMSEPPGLTQYMPDAPAELERIVAKALRKNKEERYQAAKDICLDLKSLKQRVEFQAELRRNSAPAAVNTARTAAAPTGQTDDASAATARPSSRAEYITGRIKRHKAALTALAVVLLVAAGGALWWYKSAGRSWFGADGEAPAGKMTITALTTTGNISCAAVSPDGKYVVYSMSDRPQQSSLWLMQLATSTSQLIIPAAEVEYTGVSFSPDGSYIYFVSSDGNAQTPARTLYRVPLLGGAAKKITENANTAGSFSPDGKQFVFRREISEPRQSALYVANADGSAEKQVATIRYPEGFGDPAWSPDGRVIACAAGHVRGGLNMYMVAVRTGDWTIERISPERWWWVGQMGWLADSSGLVMVASDRLTAPFQIWRLAYPGGEARRLTNDSNFYNRLSISADASTVVALHRRLTTNVWIIPREGADRARQITSGTGGYRGRLSWTPDGRIVYDSETGNAKTISIMNADGSQQKQLMGDLTGQAYVSWSRVSPDGRYIAYSSDFTGTRHIWRMNLDGSNPVQLTNGEGEDHPHFSPDNRWVFYTMLERTNSGRSTLWRVPVEGGEPTQLTDAFTAHPAVSPDGKLIACLYSEHMSPWRLAILPFEGGRPIKVFPQTVPELPVRWTPDGRAITYAESSFSASKIWLQPLGGGSPEQLSEFETDRIFGFDWSRDGKYLACVRGFWSMDAVLIKDFK